MFRVGWFKVNRVLHEPGPIAASVSPPVAASVSPPAASSSLAAAPWRRRASSGRALLPPPSHAASAPQSPPSRRTLSRRAPTTCRAQPKREERETREGHSGRLDAHSHSLSLSTCPRPRVTHTPCRFGGRTCPTPQPDHLRNPKLEISQPLNQELLCDAACLPRPTSAAYVRVQVP